MLAVLCVSIVLATVLLKQHSCIDVALGALLALALDSAFTAAERSQLTARVMSVAPLATSPAAKMYGTPVWRVTGSATMRPRRSAPIASA